MARERTMSVKTDVYGPAVDVYAYAIMLWELASRRAAYDGKDSAPPLADLESRVKHIKEFWSRVEGGLRPDPLPSAFGEEFCGLITACWQKDFKQRPTFKKILVRTA